MLIHLSNWQVTTNPNLAGDPRFEGPCIKGTDPNGRHIVTSAIESVNGRTVHTKAGTVYRLEGDPAPEFAKVLEEKKVKVLKSAPLRNYRPHMK